MSLRWDLGGNFSLSSLQLDGTAHKNQGNANTPMQAFGSCERLTDPTL